MRVRRLQSGLSTHAAALLSSSSFGKAQASARGGRGIAHFRLSPKHQPGDPDFAEPLSPFYDSVPESGNNESLCRMSIAESQRALRAGHITLPQLAEAVLTRAEVLKHSYGFFHHIYQEIDIPGPDEASLPGYGVIATVKDLNLDVPGPKRHGSALLKNAKALVANAAVERLTSQGVIIAAQTSTSEFGYSPNSNDLLVGDVRNPFDPRLTTGGSSGGSAGAVAAKAGHFSLANDAAGSIRIPASFCGCVGIRPQHSLPIAGARNVSFGVGRMSMGPIARSVRDAAVALDILSSKTPGILTSAVDGGGKGDAEPERLRIGAVSHTYWYDPEQPVKAAFRKAVGSVKAHLQDLTHTQRSFRHGQAEAVLEVLCGSVEPFYPQEDPSPYIHDWWAYNAATVMQKRLGVWATSQNARASDGYDIIITPHLRHVMEVGARISPERAQQSEDFLSTAKTSLTKFFDRYDVLLTPTVGVLPWAVERMTPQDAHDPERSFTTDWNAFTYPINFAEDFASGTLNCGWHRVPGPERYSLPIGMQVVVANRGKPFDNLRRLLRTMALVEDSLSHVNSERLFPRFGPFVFGGD